MSFGDGDSTSLIELSELIRIGSTKIKMKSNTSYNIRIAPECYDKKPSKENCFGIHTLDVSEILKNVLHEFYS